ncbi:MAG: integration host factor subunit beta [Treponema sp.]|nr:integration host factor subunit beta [Treponema sp.]
MMANKITKFDLVEAIQTQTKYEKKIVQTIIESFLEQVKSSLTNQSNIELRGFGTFELRLRKGRNSARNPKTGQTVSVKPHYVAAFRAGQELKKNLFEIPVEENQD